ncbi:MAG: hypothetical protein IKD53_04995, partial [Clostridia bacterium]|nr:hypothetical protein [Clostridia bacterium]
RSLGKAACHPFFSCVEDDDTGPFSRHQISMDAPGKLSLWNQYEAKKTYDILDMPNACAHIALPGRR